MTRLIFPARTPNRQRNSAFLTERKQTSQLFLTGGEAKKLGTVVDCSGVGGTTATLGTSFTGAAGVANAPLVTDSFSAGFRECKCARARIRRVQIYPCCRVGERERQRRNRRFLCLLSVMLNLYLGVKENKQTITKTHSNTKLTLLAKEKPVGARTQASLQAFCLCPPMFDRSSKYHPDCRRHQMQQRTCCPTSCCQGAQNESGEQCASFQCVRMAGCDHKT